MNGRTDRVSAASISIQILLLVDNRTKKLVYDFNKSPSALIHQSPVSSF